MHTIQNISGLTRQANKTKNGFFHTMYFIRWLAFHAYVVFFIQPIKVSTDMSIHKKNTTFAFESLCFKNLKHSYDHQYFLCEDNVDEQMF